MCQINPFALTGKISKLGMKEIASEEEHRILSLEEKSAEAEVLSHGMY